MFRSVSYVRDDQAQCIEVDHPSRLYLTDGFVPTHNTFGCILWLIHEAVNSQHRNAECWWAAPVYQQAETAYTRTCDLLRSVDPEGRTWKAHDTKLVITLAPPAARIRFRSAEKPDNLYGEDVIACVADEATRMREEAWHALRSTLTATKGRARIIGNVKGRHNWVYRLARRAEAGEPGWHYAKITAGDAVEAGILDRSEIDSARSMLPEAVFRELYYAEPSDDGGNPFGLQHIAACVLGGRADDSGDSLDTVGAVPGSVPVAFGIDLARKQDWLVVHGLDAAGRTVAWDRWQRIPWEESYRRIESMIGDTPTLVDSTGIGDVVLDRLQRMCPAVQGYHFSPTGKQHLMEGLAVAIQSRQVSFPDGPIRAELESFEFEVTRTATRYSAPEGMHDDCVCALALAVERLGTFTPAGATLIGGERPPVPEDVWQSRKRMLDSAWDMGR